MKLPSCPRTLIINILRKNPDGLTLTSIAQLTGLHRHTATKYVYELKGAGVINERDVGPAKLCYLREGLSKSEEKKVVGRLNGNGNWNERVKVSRDTFHRNRKSSASTGQVQILSLFILLFLIPTTAIIAHNTSQIMTGGNLVLENINVSEVAAETANPEAVQPLEDGIAQETNITSAEEPAEQNEAPSEQLPAENLTIQENLTEINVSVGMEENQATPETVSNETVLPDEGIFENGTADNLSSHEVQNETQTTGGNVTEPGTETTWNETEQQDWNITEANPILTVSISSPEKTVRGESIDISAIVTNSGNAEARNVRLEWIVPAGFEIVSGEIEQSCGTMGPGTECVKGVTLSTSLSTDVGRREIKVQVRYEK
ncbi:MAG TPA: hypothetical protein VJ485_01230 [archaeon]|nr:hypothetical protein [archaeon]